MYKKSHTCHFVPFVVVGAYHLSITQPSKGTISACCSISYMQTFLHVHSMQKFECQLIFLTDKHSIHYHGLHVYSIICNSVLPKREIHGKYKTDQANNKSLLPDIHIDSE